VVSYDELTSDSIREFWTESECLFVYAGVCESHIDLVFNKFIKDLLGISGLTSKFSFKYLLSSFSI
jgi:hypothetical protein